MGLQATGVPSDLTQALYTSVFNTWSACPKGIYRTNFLIFFPVFRPFWPLNPFKMALKVVLEVLLDVLEVLLEVLDLSWRSWRWFWGTMY